MRYSLLFIWMIISGIALGQKTILLANKVYEPQIRTVQIYSDQGGTQDNLLPAVAPLGQMDLVLEFDDLQASRNNYYAKIIHCNYDWTKSILMDLDFMSDFNETTLNDYTLSSGTHIPYFHYRFPLPQVKLPGNYVLMIYRDGDKSDLILTHRFMVHSDLVTMVQDRQLSGGATLQLTNQQLNFTLDYGKIDIMNPLESMHIVVRQNQRWDNAKMDIKPTFVRDSERLLEFHFFDQDNFFNGGNEFRFVDFRSLNYPGQNTGSLNKTVKPYQLYVQVDLPRTDEAYAQYNDLDGNYTIENKDYAEPKISSNYVNVTFTLNPLKQVNDPVYVIGAFNNWDRNDENRMKYNPNKGNYETTFLLKQGLYNYAYWIESAVEPSYLFEGSHFETENVYEILVYNHSFQPNADQMIGYFVIPVNPR